MVGCKIVSIAESVPDIDKTDTKLNNDAERRKKALNAALEELHNVRVIGIAVDRDRFTVNYTILFEV